MKWPFFRSSKRSESKHRAATMVSAPRQQVAAIKSGFEAAVQNRPSTQSPPATDARATADAQGTIHLPMSSILPQLPSNLFLADCETQLARITVPVSADLILPQLASGRVTLRVSDLLPLVPSNFLKQPVQHSADQHTVVLPLEEVVGAIPADAFQLSHEVAVDTDSSEFTNLPALFDESLLQERPTAPPTEATTESAEQVAVAETTAPGLETLHPSALTGMPDHISISMRSLIAVMPDRVFLSSRAELWSKVNVDWQVSLPLEPILPQLQNAHVCVDLKTVIDAMPPALFVRPLPDIAGESVPLPLEEIVPQLPQLAFTSQLTQTEEPQPAETEIPTPFFERTAQPVEPTPAAPAEAVEPTPAPVEEPAELAVESLENEAFAIFAEKTETPEPVVPEPVVETVAETRASEPTPGPVVEPVAETVAEIPVPEAAPEPVAEPVQVAETPQEVVEPTAVVETPQPAEPVEVAQAPEVVQPVQPVEVPPVIEPVQAVEVPQPAEPEKVEAETVEVAPVQQPEPAVPVFAEVVTPRRDEDKFLVDLNRCTVEDLARIEGVGPGLARRIIEFRNARGKFASVHELRQIPGVGRKTFRALVGTEPRTLNSLLGVLEDRDLSLREIVELTCVLPGVEGCILSLSDGLFLTGHLPEHLDQNTVSVFAPQIFKKISRYSKELRCGEVRRFTIFTDQQPMTIFHAGEVYLIIVHDARRYTKSVLTRCERISQEIARMCRQRVVV